MIKIIVFGRKISAVVLAALFSSCTCSSTKRYRVNKIKEVNKIKVGYPIKRRFDIRKFRKKDKSNLVPNVLKIAGALVGVASLGSLVKKYFGKYETEKNGDFDKFYYKHNYKTEKLKMEVKLSKTDEEFIRKNFFICKWPGRNLCWNNTFIQYLMCPDIIRKFVCASRIMNVLNWICSVLKKEYAGPCLERVVDIPDDVRPIVEQEDVGAFHDDGSYCYFNKWLECGEMHNPKFLFCGLYKFDLDEKDINKYNTDKEGKVMSMSDIGTEIKKRSGLKFIIARRRHISKGLVNLEDMGIHNRFILFSPSATGVGNFVRSEHIFRQFSDSFEFNIKKTIEKVGYNPNIYDNYLVEMDLYGEPRESIDLRFLDSRPFGYYPTFISFCDMKSSDYKSCYLIYNNRKIKFVIYINTFNNVAKSLSLDGIKGMMKNAKCAFVRYSRSDIVEKYFTPG